MSDKCSNCDCADSSQCVKKGNQYGFDIIESEHSESMMMETGAENDGKCKCGSSCACVDCQCGAH